MTGTRDTLEGFLSPDRLAALNNRPRSRLYSLARTTLSIPGALAMAQEQRCFHCRGLMPVLYERLDAARPTREHALPKAARTAGECAAQLLAHKLCNEIRRDAPFTAGQWERAIRLWTRADRHWLEAGKSASPFLAWIALALQQQAEVAP